MEEMEWNGSNFSFCNANYDTPSNSGGREALSLLNYIQDSGTPDNSF